MKHILYDDFIRLFFSFFFFFFCPGGDPTKLTKPEMIWVSDALMFALKGENRQNSISVQHDSTFVLEKGDKKKPSHLMKSV